MKPFNIPPIYEGLAIIMRYFPDNFNQQAVAEIETLQEYCMEKISDDSERFLTLLFLKALKQHIGTNTIDEHIYLKKFEIPQIKLFDILIKEFPFVSYSHIICNQLLAEEIRKHEKAILMDVGIGRGLQMVGVIELLKINKGNLKELRIVGIEPFKEALDVSGQIITKSFEGLNIEVKKFISIHRLIEEMDQSDFETYFSSEDGALIINESLALHHIDTQEHRHNVLKTLRALKPYAFVITEPNVDNFEPDFYTRFKNSFQHFYHVFQVIDQLNISREEKSGLKLFFGREIEDIIGKQKEARFEKHEPAINWIDKLKKVGFSMRSNFYEGESVINCGILMENHPEGFLGFRYDNETVLAVMVAEAPHYAVLEPKETDDGFIHQWFPEHIHAMNEKLPINPMPVDSILLDKNEMPYDIPEALKQDVFRELDKIFWNRYPSPYYPEIEKLIADYLQVNPSSVLVGAGAAQLISIVLNVFGNNSHENIVCSPSFSLFDYYLKINNISFKTWELNDRLEFDLKLFPKLAVPAMIMIASPNNPTGNTLHVGDLEYLLKTFPGSITIVDEVYYEFSDQSVLPLLKMYSNLIIIRSLSKAYSAAGIRLGYAISSPQMINNLRKYILPFSLNHLSVAFAKVLFGHQEYLHFAGRNVLSVIRERDNLFQQLSNRAGDKPYQVFNSRANFLLVRFKSIQAYRHYLDLFVKNKIKVLHLGDHPFLENAIRISIGNASQNQTIVELLS